MESDLVYLTVAFKDKDVVKALGARWDGKNKLWFAPKGSEARFARWIAGAGSSRGGISGSLQLDAGVHASSSGGLSDPKPGGRIGASLSSVLFEASEAIKKALPVPRWIIAEVASVRTHSNSGHTYIELVEHDNTGREIAKANARVWAGNARILRRFEKETGGAIVDGMKLLVLGQADFSIQYGFGVTIDDIDPAWTLGEMQMKLVKIREKLMGDGVFDLNAKSRPASDFVNVVVIAPDGAAGLGDFMIDADSLVRAGLCSFHFIASVFEGVNALGSLVSAMAAASEMAARREVDAVVVVRGGGAKTSLNWLNEYEIARQICVMPCPVMVGVGHERDKTVLDEVCCESFDTPSKVIGAIVSRIVGNAKASILALEQLRGEGRRVCSNAKRDSQRLRTDVDGSAKSRVATERAKIGLSWSKIKDGWSGVLGEAKTELEMVIREVVGLGPKASLDRGYCVVSQGGAAIGRLAGLDTGSQLRLRMADGEIDIKCVEKDVMYE